MHLLVAVVPPVITPVIAEDSNVSDTQGTSMKEFDFQANRFSDSLYALNPFCRSRYTTQLRKLLTAKFNTVR